MYQMGIILFDPLYHGGVPQVCMIQKMSLTKLTKSPTLLWSPDLGSDTLHPN